MDWFELFLVAVVILPILILWFGCLVDAISRPDVNGVGKTLWVLVILFLPLIGSLIYITTRPAVIVSLAGLTDSVWKQSAASLPTSQTAVDGRRPWALNDAGLSGVTIC
jgi:hypothetical protein